MEFAANYSPMLADLVAGGLVRVDRFKCPAWPDLIAQARALRPVYVHTPIIVGTGLGAPYDAERNAPADLEYYADLLAETGTPLLNTHFYPSLEAFPGLRLNDLDARRGRMLAETALRDLEPALRRFGPAGVTVENCVPDDDQRPFLLALPEVIGAVVEGAGCGFLLDISHARLSAGVLGVDEHAYTAALPVDKIREVHVTGIQRMEGRWLELLRQVNDPIWDAGRMAGRRQDHLPMTEEDRESYRWMMGEIHAGRWSRPWVVACEYGGVGGFWNVLCDREVYLRDLPFLENSIRPPTP